MLTLNLCPQHNIAYHTLPRAVQLKIYFRFNEKMQCTCRVACPRIRQSAAISALKPIGLCGTQNAELV